MPSPLPALIKDELALLRQFVTLLQDEQRALVEGELERLLPLAEEKSRLATELGRLAVARNQALAALGLAADKSGMDAWLVGQAPTVPSRGHWAELLSLATETRRQNELNGKLINTRMQHNQRALAVLAAATSQAMLYGPDGQQRPLTSGRDFGAV
ncbi:FlgN protein [mine drainage metagenome]|uniref:FlgN protein n=1 Tax=mine drainage metagenome TaxID=410659 RepID=A0A1J5RP33_9ZZZZ